MKPNLLNPTMAQMLIHSEFMAEPYRPSSRVYDSYQERMKRVAVNRKVKLSDCKNLEKGYNPGDVVPLPGFNPNEDLPEGFGLYPMCDSGGNCKILDAGRCLLAESWNSWRGAYNEESYK